QAFLSPEMPRQYVNTRKNLIGILRQYDRLGGPNVDVRFVNVEPNSKEVEEALSLGLQKQASRDTVAGRVIEQDVFMGAVITSTMDEIILPFIEGDTSIEYQLTRSIATATAEQDRLKIGILKTDAHFDNLQVEGSEYDWVAPIALAELQRQYDVVSISPEDLPALNGDPNTPVQAETETDTETGNTDTKDTPPDVLIVADPSSLSTTALSMLTAYIEQGNPTLIMADPLPFYWSTYQGPTELGIVNAPAQPRISPQAAWSPILTSQEPKADGGTAATLLNSLGVEWQHDTTVWSVNNPHVGFKPILPQRFGDRWVPEYGLKETLFVFAKSYGDHQAFNPQNPISSGLHELMFMYPGSIEPTENAQTTFDPLVILKPGSAGHMGWEELTEEYISTRLEFNQLTGESNTVSGPEVSRYTGNNIRTLRKRPALKRPGLAAEEKNNATDDENEKTRQVLDDYRHVLAAQIRGKGDNQTNVVFIADIDFISDMFFQQREAIDTALDNFTFFLNAIEVLAGDESFVRLRNRRQTPRTLATIEGMKEPYRVAAVKERDKAEAQV
ncbi:MAG: GldG family protein, partial [Pirellulaceae bacterium]|nr:GldG family protein [Pirellulaceae bacterium]